MSDFITISCPSCGGQLKRGANTTTYTCDYCGQQHRLRVEDVEEFGCCPVCHRNDRVEIVRAIQSKGGNLAYRLAPPDKTEKIFSYKPKSKPKPLEKPSFVPVIPISQRSKKSNLVYILSIVSMAFFILVAAVSKTWVLPLLFFLLGVAGLFYNFILQINIKKEEKRLIAAQEQQLLNEWHSQNEKLESEWSRYIEAYDKEYKRQFANLDKSYSQAMRRYDLLYYCHRDDCVFIPGESGHAPSAQLQGFLHSEDTEA